MNMNTNSRNDFQPTQDEIASSAYDLWESGGRPSGRDMEYWLQAEAKLKTARQQKQPAQSPQSAASSQPAFAAPQRTALPAPGNSLRTPGIANGRNKSNRPRKQQTA
ncbi:MAG TPA: DUF2934 domain-containing protein [Verrucomicrobiae bacterium]|jgi:hypothetical protein